MVLESAPKLSHLTATSQATNPHVAIDWKCGWSELRLDVTRKYLMKVDILKNYGEKKNVKYLNKFSTDDIFKG